MYSISVGRINEILTCTGCMQRCLYTSSFEEGCGTSCMINPLSGKENIWAIDEVKNKKKIACIGSGPAGLQAACILRKKGHQVKIYEKESTAGGQYRVVAVPSMKQDLAKTFLEKGDHVVLASTGKENEAKELINKLSKFGDISFLKCNAACQEDCQDVVHEVL